MKIRTSLVALGSLMLSLAACGAVDRPRLDPRVAARIEVNKNDPPPGCEYLGAVKGSTLIGELGEAHADIVRNAVLGGGNYVSVDMVEKPVVAGVGGGYTIRGRLFACPRSERAPAETASADRGASGGTSEGSISARSAKTSDEITLPKAICEPDCSPGFTCVHGACVTACNPACGSGEQCGADHACHAVR